MVQHHYLQQNLRSCSKKFLKIRILGSTIDKVRRTCPVKNPGFTNVRYHSTTKTNPRIMKERGQGSDCDLIGCTLVVLLRWCPLAGLARLDALPHAAKFSKLHEVWDGVAEARRQKGRVDCRLPCLPAAQQWLESFVPEDGVQLEPVLGDVSGAVVAARVGAHGWPEPRLIQRRRKRRRVVMQLLWHLTVKQKLTVFQTPRHNVHMTMSATAWTVEDIETDRTVSTGRCITTFGTVVTAPHAAVTRRRRRTGQRFTPATPAAWRHDPLVRLSLGHIRRWTLHRCIDGRIANGKTVHHFHGGITKTRSKRVFPGMRHVVRIISAHDPTDC